MSSYLLVTGDFVTTGGMDRANHALASYLARRGDDVHLVAHRVANDLMAYSNVTVHRVPKPVNSYMLGEPLLDRVGRYWAKRIAARGGRVVVNGGNCEWGDVNWVHYVHAAYLPVCTGTLARRLKGRWVRRTALVTERNALRCARLVFANSKRTKQDLIDKVGVAADRVHVVYLGTEPQAFRSPTPSERAAVRAELGWEKGRPIVAFVGALGDRRKGFDILLEAWGRLCSQQGWDADLAVVGAGAELSFWKQSASEAGIASRVHFLGFRSDVPRLMWGCDALVAPARYEPYGLGVQEALYAGLPAFVTADAGVAERYPVDLHDLLLSRSCSADDVVEKLLRWRNRMSEIQATVGDFAKRLRAYSSYHMAQEMVRLIHELGPEPMSGPHTTNNSLAGIA